MQKNPNELIYFLIGVTCLILILTAFIITILYLYRKRQIDYQKVLETLKSDYEKNLLSTQLEIQEQTFQRVSREIHDNICLNLTLAKLSLVTLDSANIIDISERLNSSVEILTNSIRELSDISHGMNSELLTSHGLIKVLENEIEKIERPGLVRIDYFIEGNPVFMDSQKELVIFRIIQEAFNNILKHAKAKNVILKLNYDDNDIKVTVQDDGSGFIPEELNESGCTKAKLGLLNMRKRANLINGSCEITSKINYGTTISLSIPY
jgi:signal transduction histidine kinase